MALRPDPLDPRQPPVRIAPATADDAATLWLMLTYAASMGKGGPDQVAMAQADPCLCAYVEGWGRQAGDLGVIAREAGGRAIGAAWLRLSHEATPGRVAEPSVPELAAAVHPEARGRGVGTHLLQALIVLAAPTYRRIRLSVRTENPARRFYGRLGFVEESRITNRVGGESIVMTLELPHPLAPPVSSAPSPAAGSDRGPHDASGPRPSPPPGG